MTFTDDTYFNGESLKSMHNKSSKKSGLDRKEKQAAQQYRKARKNKRTF